MCEVKLKTCENKEKTRLWAEQSHLALVPNAAIQDKPGTAAGTKSPDETNFLLRYYKNISHLISKENARTSNLSHFY